jgi:hypothetical protein
MLGLIRIYLCGVRGKLKTDKRKMLAQFNFFDKLNDKAMLYFITVY